MKGEVKADSEGTVEAVFRGQSRMTARGQVTVPTEVRRRFGLKPGDVLCFLEIEGTVILKLGPLVLTQ
jgi:AbrB family looped-hinge helix DNA binding protein